MRVYRGDDSQHTGQGREHPWTVSETDPDIQYYNFKESPELVREKLEDFKPLEAFPAIETFYRLLEFLNGPDSELETNDCVLRAPSANTTNRDVSPKELVVVGRLMVLYRSHFRNVADGNTQRLVDLTMKCLNEVDSGFMDAAIEISLLRTRFIEVPVPPNLQTSSVVVLKFWVWGDTETEVMDNLDRLFQGFEVSFRNLSVQISHRAASTEESGGL